MSKRLNLRAQAARVLIQVIKHRQSLANLLPVPSLRLTPQDEALLQELCFGVCRWYERLDSQVSRLLDKPLRAKDIEVKLLLLLGLYQLQFTRIPSHAAISETVQACKQLKKASASGLVNAILRRSLRERDKLESQLSDQDTFRFSHPQWLLDRLRSAWPDHWQAICEANNQRAPMTLRVNALQSSREDYLVTLQQAGISASACRWSRQGIQLEQPVAVDKLPGFGTGLCSVQDEAAQLAAPLLQLEPDLQVLDACAAPGGKTCHLLETEPALKQLTALELDPQRARKIQDNLDRLGLRAELVIGDASQPSQWAQSRQFDRILLDAPCSATGVIRRHPDIKQLRRAQDIAALAQLQGLMLEALWPLLKPRGILLYATCSVCPEENEHIISHFLSQHTDASELTIAADWGITRPVGRQLFAQPQGHDGFYYARLQKR